MNEYVNPSVTVERQRYFDDLDRVGPQKPLGFLPLRTITDFHHQDPLVVAQNAQNRGLLAIIIEEKDCMVYTGALCVADENALGQLLNARSDVLEKYNWPKEPEAFMRKVCGVFAPEKTPLYDLIADAFADYTNPYRTDSK